MGRMHTMAAVLRHPAMHAIAALLLKLLKPCRENPGFQAMHRDAHMSCAVACSCVAPPIRHSVAASGASPPSQLPPPGWTLGLPSQPHMGCSMNPLKSDSDMHSGSLQLAMRESDSLVSAPDIMPSFIMKVTDSWKRASE